MCEDQTGIVYRSRALEAVIASRHALHLVVEVEIKDADICEEGAHLRLHGHQTNIAIHANTHEDDSAFMRRCMRLARRTMENPHLFYPINSDTHETIMIQILPVVEDRENDPNDVHVEFHDKPGIKLDDPVDLTLTAF